MELFITKSIDDPSWLEDEYISVEMQNIKLNQALRNIISSVDGDVDFNINEIHVTGPIRPRKPAAPGKTRSGGKVDGAGYVSR